MKHNGAAVTIKVGIQTSITLCTPKNIVFSGTKTASATLQKTYKRIRKGFRTNLQILTVLCGFPDARKPIGFSENELRNLQPYSENRYSIPESLQVSSETFFTSKPSRKLSAYSRKHLGSQYLFVENLLEFPGTGNNRTVPQKAHTVSDVTSKTLLGFRNFRNPLGFPNLFSETY